MANDLTIDVRRGIIHLLRTNSAVNAIVAQRIYDEQPDPVTWPYVRWGVPIRQNYEASILEGVDISTTIHAFDKSKGTGRIDNLASAIESAIADYAPTDPLSLVDLQWINTQVIPDGAEASAYHAIIQHRIVVAVKQT